MGKVGNGHTVVVEPLAAISTQQTIPSIDIFAVRRDSCTYYE